MMALRSLSVTSCSDTARVNCKGSRASFRIRGASPTWICVLEMTEKHARQGVSVMHASTVNSHSHDESQNERASVNRHDPHVVLTSSKGGGQERTHRGDGDVTGADAQFVVNASCRGDDVIVVREGLAHAHHHHVAQPFVLFLCTGRVRSE